MAQAYGPDHDLTIRCDAHISIMALVVAIFNAARKQEFERLSLLVSPNKFGERDSDRQANAFDFWQIELSLTGLIFAHVALRPS